MYKKKLRGTRNKQESILRRRALGALLSCNIFTHFAINVYPILFQKGLDVASQTLRVQISLRQPSTQGTGPVGPAQSLQESGSVCAKDHLISACGVGSGGLLRVQGCCPHTTSWSASEETLGRLCWALLGDPQPLPPPPTCSGHSFQGLLLCPRLQPPQPSSEATWASRATTKRSRELEASVSPLGATRRRGLNVQLPCFKAG